MNKIMVVTCMMGVLALGGCVPSSGGSSRSGETLSQQVARHDQQLQNLMSQVGQVEQVLPGQAEMWSQMQTMRQDLNSVMGKADQMGADGGAGGPLNERVARLEAMVRQMASQLGVNADSLDAAGASPSGGGQAVTPQPVSTQSQPAAPANTADILYEAGIKSFDARKYKEAVVSFKDFTSTYPKHKLAGNAHFWLGESYFQMKEFPRAALAYQEVIQNYQGSAKMQAAMLKQGMALAEAGKKEAAKERWAELVKKYPNAPEATRAKQLLQGK